MAQEEAITWRLKYSDALEQESTEPIVEFHSTKTSSGTQAIPNDATLQDLPKMPFVGMWLDEGKKLVLEGLGDAADTIESEECGGHLVFEFKNKRTGTVTVKEIRIGDTGAQTFTGFDSTDDVVLNTSAFVRLGAYTVPDGFMIRPKAGEVVHAYFGDDT